MTHDSVMEVPYRGWPGTGCEGELLALGGGLYRCRECGLAVVLETGGRRLLGVYPGSTAAREAARQIAAWEEWADGVDASAEGGAR